MSRRYRRQGCRTRGGLAPAHQPLKGRRFTDEERRKALELVSAGLKRVEIAKVAGTTVESLRRWKEEAERRGVMPLPPAVRHVAGENKIAPSQPQPPAKPSNGGEPQRSVYAPKDPAQGLAEYESAAIVELKRKHPSYGPAQIRAQLKRFKGWRIANKAIARVLRQYGYELVHRKSRPQGPEPTRFEAPRRNALWQADFTDLRVGDDKFCLLVFLDDFSRYVVGHQLCDSPCAEAALEVLRRAMARHGKPEAVRTDRGGAFNAGAFTRALENELIDHIVGRSYHPQGGGKVEAVIGTVKRELWEVQHFCDRAEAERHLTSFFDEYNERRAHMGIDGLTPADRFFGRADRVLARIDALSRRRTSAQSLCAPVGVPVEESVTGPMEVLRLILVDGQMELRLFGARVRLGCIES